MTPAPKYSTGLTLNENLPSCRLADFRKFWDSKDVWGDSNDVYMEDVLIHIKKSDGLVTSYTNDGWAIEGSKESNVLNDGFLEPHDEDDVVYVECGFLLASKGSKTTRFVFNTQNTKSDEWSYDLGDILRAWMANDPKQLMLFTPESN